MSCSFRIQVVLGASAYDAGENVNQNSGDIIFQREERPDVALHKKEGCSHSHPASARVIGIKRIENRLNGFQS